MTHFLDGLNARELNGALVSVLEDAPKGRVRVKLLHGVFKASGVSSFSKPYEEGRILSVPERCVKKTDDDKENVDPNRGSIDGQRKRSRSPRGREVENRDSLPLVQLKGHDLKSLRASLYDDALNIPTEQKVEYLSYYQNKTQVFRQSILIQTENHIFDEPFVCRFMVFMTSSEQGAIEQLRSAAASFGIETGGRDQLEKHLDGLPSAAAQKVSHRMFSNGCFSSGGPSTFSDRRKKRENAGVKRAASFCIHEM